MPQGKWTSAGGVVIPSEEQPDRVWIVKPSNNYGPWCFPKGRVDPGEGLHGTAVQEVQEEAGVPARILPNGTLGTGVGSYSITHYFMMVQTGPAGSTDEETEEVRLATFDEAQALFAGDGNQRDIAILAKAKSWIQDNLMKSEPQHERYLRLKVSDLRRLIRENLL